MKWFKNGEAQVAVFGASIVGGKVVTIIKAMLDKLPALAGTVVNSIVFRDDDGLVCNVTDGMRLAHGEDLDSIVDERGLVPCKGIADPASRSVVINVAELFRVALKSATSAFEESVDGFFAISIRHLFHLELIRTLLHELMHLSLIHDVETEQKLLLSPEMEADFERRCLQVEEEGLDLLWRAGVNLEPDVKSMVEFNRRLEELFSGSFGGFIVRQQAMEEGSFAVLSESDDKAEANYEITSMKDLLGFLAHEDPEVPVMDRETKPETEPEPEIDAKPEPVRVPQGATHQETVGATMAEEPMPEMVYGSEFDDDFQEGNFIMPSFGVKAPSDADQAVVDDKPVTETVNIGPTYPEEPETEESADLTSVTMAEVGDILKGLFEKVFRHMETECGHQSGSYTNPRGIFDNPVRLDPKERALVYATDVTLQSGQYLKKEPVEGGALRGSVYPMTKSPALRMYIRLPNGMEFVRTCDSISGSGRGALAQYVKNTGNFVGLVRDNDNGVVKFKWNRGALEEWRS